MVTPAVTPDGGRVARNTTYLTLALIGQKILSALYIPIIAGLIGPSATGEYLGALSFINIFAIFIDLGLTPAFIRQTARDPREGRQEFNTIITFKLLSSVVVTACLIATVVLLRRSNVTHPNMIYIQWASVGMILDTLTATSYGFFRGLQLLQFEAIGTVLHRVVVMIVGLSALQLGAPPVVVIIALVVGSTANFLYASFHLWRRGISWRPNWHWPLLRKLLWIALPFGLASLFTAIYGNSDTILLQIFKDRRAIGLYGTANKMILAFQVIPAALVGAIYPAMSAAYINDRHRLQRLFVDAMRYLMVVFIPIMVVIIILAHPLILHFYKRVWLDAVWPLRVLAVGLPFLFLHYPIGYLLNAANRQTRNTINIAITVGINIIVNLFTIKYFSYRSVAVVSVMSSAMLFTLGAYYARKVIPLGGRELLATLSKTLMAGLILAGLGHGLLNYTKGLGSVILVALAMCLAYLMMIFLFRIVTRHDVDALMSRIRRV